MRRGAYVARLDLDDPHHAGVARKIGAQCAALARAGLPTALHAMRGGAVIRDDTVLRPAGQGAAARRAAHYCHFWTDTLETLDAADFLYVRFQGAGPGFLNMLAQYRARRPDAPIVLEIPTYPYRTERRGARRHLLGMVDDLGTLFLRRHVARIVTFSAQEEIMGIPTIRTQNGVDVDALPLAEPPPPEGPLRLVGVANFAFWHGYDRIIEGVARMPHDRREEIVVDLVGSGNYLRELRELTDRNSLSDRIMFHGPLTGKALSNVVSKAHVGLGCLGLHRTDKDTSDLKTREYCARGLPFLADRLEKDFKEVSDYVLVCESGETPIDIEAVVGWRRGIDGERAGKTLRAHAEARLTWDAKMAPVVEWLQAEMAT